MEVLKDWHIAEITGIVVAALALIVGIWHIREIRKVLGEAKAQRDAATAQVGELQNIKESLSTRYIGLFPEYYPEIADLINDARREIFILCDFPGYASFSDRRSWLRYKQTLERKSAEGVKIQLTCFDAGLRRRILVDQFFGADELWDEWKKAPLNKSRLEVLLNYHREDTIGGLTRDRFFEILEAEEIDALQGPFLNAVTTQISASTPFYFWLIDERRAIFAIASLGEREYGFSTTDQKLITAFLEMRARHLKEASASAVPASGERIS